VRPLPPDPMGIVSSILFERLRQHLDDELNQDHDLGRFGCAMYGAEPEGTHPEDMRPSVLARKGGRLHEQGRPARSNGRANRSRRR
jgi:hypothetical protein